LLTIPIAASFGIPRDLERYSATLLRASALFSILSSVLRFTTELLISDAIPFALFKALV